MEFFELVYKNLNLFDELRKEIDTYMEISMTFETKHWLIYELNAV